MATIKDPLSFGWTSPKEIFTDQRVPKRKFTDIVNGPGFQLHKITEEFLEDWWYDIQKMDQWERDATFSPQQLAEIQRHVLQRTQADAARKQKEADEKRRVFEQEVAKAESVSAAELEAINCPAEVTRDMLMAAGYGSRWFTRDEMQRIHRVMAHRLEALDMLERRNVHDEKTQTIRIAYRLKGT